MPCFSIALRPALARRKNVDFLRRGRLRISALFFLVSIWNFESKCAGLRGLVREMTFNRLAGGQHAVHAGGADADALLSGGSCADDGIWSRRATGRRSWESVL